MLPRALPAVLCVSLVTAAAAAAGNNFGDNVAYPAKFEGCMVVSATDNADSLPPWSNHGDEIDVAAPGSTVYSLLRTSEYKYLSGTSMAAPHVSGLACLIWTMNPALSADDVASIITATADDCDRFSGAGVFDLFDYLCFQNAFMRGCP